MDLRGKVRSWNEDKGFGFIRPEAGGRDVFAHASGLLGGQRLSVGDTVRYRVGQDKQGRLCATHVRVEGGMVVDQPGSRVRVRRGRPSAKRAAPVAGVHNLGLKLAVLAALLVLPSWGSLAVLAAYQSLLPLAAYLGVSVLSLVLYWQDKRSALEKRWRTPESSLHLAELAGGWPGALVAQQLLRHKTRKLSFQLVCWASVALHQAIWIDYLFVQRLLHLYLDVLR